jgi:hypothetical protein
MIYHNIINPTNYDSSGLEAFYNRNKFYPLGICLLRIFRPYPSEHCYPLLWNVFLLRQDYHDGPAGITRMRILPWINIIIVKRHKVIINRFGIDALFEFYYVFLTDYWLWCIPTLAFPFPFLFLSLSLSSLFLTPWYEEWTRNFSRALRVMVSMCSQVMHHHYHNSIS